MDDTPRGLNDEQMSGRGDETSRNYAGPAGPRPGPDRRSAAAGATGTDTDPDRRTREIRAEIEQTREDMSETIDAIQEKLRPGNIAAGAKDKVMNATTERVRKMTDSASETAQNAMESTRQMAGEVIEGARNNAIPAVMIGIGVAWLLVDRFRDKDRGGDWRRYGARRYDSSYGAEGYYEGAGYTGSEAGEYGRESSPGYRAGLSEAYDRTASGLTGAREAARRTGRRAQNGFGRLMRSNPLMVGAAAMAVGAAVGLALPETERENEWMGETRDNIVERAQDLAKDAASRAQEAVGDAAGEVASRVVTGKEGESGRRP